jgi:hypothetical protein
MAENRGGKRKGEIGKLRPNRGDLRSPTSMVPTGQEYGQAGAQQARLKAAPIGGPKGSPKGIPQGRVPVDDLRGKIPSVTDPTQRPQEPVTAGLPLGPGPGPEALATASAGSMELSVLRAIFLLNPNEDLRRHIEWVEQNL